LLTKLASVGPALVKLVRLGRSRPAATLLVVTSPERDHLGGRRLSRGEEAAWYLVAFVTYVAAAIVEKGLLNWIVGPLWLVVVVWVGPELVDRVRGRR
jgi:hypothetical protein